MPAGQFPAAAPDGAWYESRVTRYEMFRKRLAPIALIVAIGVLATQTCNKKQADRETIELRFGGHAAAIQRVRADVFVDDAPVAHVERDLARDPTTPVRFPAVIDGGRARILVDLTTTHGPRRLSRTLTAGELVIVDLGPDLADL